MLERRGERWLPWGRMEKGEPETRKKEKDERAERGTRRMGEIRLGKTVEEG